jgi:8-oxo-dGTP diphosphatase
LARHTRYQALIVENDSVLLIKHREHATGRAYWVIPGGGMDDDETEEECVIRELNEETNLDVEIESLLFDEPGHPDGAYRWRKTFLCRPVGGHPSPGFEPEAEAAENYAITEVRWFDLRDETDWGPDLLTNPFTYPQLVKARKRLGYLPWPRSCTAPA